MSLSEFILIAQTIYVEYPDTYVPPIEWIPNDKNAPSSL